MKTATPGTGTAGQCAIGKGFARPARSPSLPRRPISDLKYQTQRKILCIEDDRETAALIAEELVDRGYAVTIAHDGRQGLTAILETMPDLVLSDISMPLMSGFELLERLIALAPRFAKMPFVFLTALSDRDNELKGRQSGRRGRLRDQTDRFRRAGTIIAARLAGVARTGLWPNT